MARKSTATADQRAALAKNFLAVREKLEMTQEELASFLGLSVESVRRYEKGHMPDGTSWLCIYERTGINQSEWMTPGPAPTVKRVPWDVRVMPLGRVPTDLMETLRSTVELHKKKAVKLRSFASTSAKGAVKNHDAAQVTRAGTNAIREHDGK